MDINKTQALHDLQKAFLSIEEACLVREEAEIKYYGVTK